MQTPTKNVIQTTCIFPNGQASTMLWTCELQKEANNISKEGISFPNLFEKWLQNQMRRSLAP